MESTCISICQVAADVLSEFLEVAIHSILYTCDVYPAEAFETRRKYNVPVQMAIHPSISSYISNSMTTIHKLLQKNEVEKIVVTILDEKEKPLKHYVFDIDIPLGKDLRRDSNLIDVELSLRALCLKINTSNGVSKVQSDANTFNIHIHTKEATAVALALSEDPANQEFPWIEAETNQSDLENGIILPLKTTDTQIGKVQLYVVEKES